MHCKLVLYLLHTFLSMNCARLNRLTNHNGAIPENEIWIKIGGDKGGKSVKAPNMQCGEPQLCEEHLCVCGI